MSFSERRRALIAATMQGGLPGIYQQVEWVQAASGNGAYIDLGIAFDTSCIVEISYGYTSSNAQIFGAAESSGKYRCMLSAHYADEFYAPGTFSTFYFTTQLADGTIRFDGGAYPRYIPASLLPVTNIFIVRPGYYEGKSIDTGLASYATESSVPTTYSMTNHLFLMGQNYNGHYRGENNKRIYYFKYWDKNNALVRDMIPCYRKADGVIGMYDFASKQFFTNAGSGSFTKGADV